MKYIARYRKKGVNPFKTRPGISDNSILTIKAEIPDNMSSEKVKELAEKAAPTGYEFVEVNPEK